MRGFFFLHLIVLEEIRSNFAAAAAAAALDPIPHNNDNKTLRRGIRPPPIEDRIQILRNKILIAMVPQLYVFLMASSLPPCSKICHDHDVTFQGLCRDTTMEDSSTSCINYVYSEEASSVSSSVDGDLAYEIADSDGGGQIDDEYSNPDSSDEDSSDEDTSDEDTSDGDTSDNFTGPSEMNLEKYDHMSDKEDDAYDKAMKAFKTNKPTKEDWIKTWPEGRKEAKSAWVNVYSHFEEQGELGCGGYAVIIRNRSAQPIAASANFSTRGKSYFFHVLDGIKAALRLASEHGCSSPKVRCSSRTVVMLLSQLASGGCLPFYENCKGTKIGEICETCTMAIVPCVSKHAFVTAAGLLGELRGKLDSFDIEWEREMTNKAAQYLAKEVKKKALQDGIENYNKPDMKPDEFSDGLVSIMLDDAFDNLYYNRDAWTKIIRAV